MVWTVRVEALLVVLLGKVLSFSNFLDSADFALNTFNSPTWAKTKGAANNFITMDTQPA